MDIDLASSIAFYLSGAGIAGKGEGKGENRINAKGGKKFSITSLDWNEIRLTKALFPVRPLSLRALPNSRLSSHECALPYDDCST